MLVSNINFRGMYQNLILPSRVSEIFQYIPIKYSYKKNTLDLLSLFLFISLTIHCIAMISIIWAFGH